LHEKEGGKEGGREEERKEGRRKEEIFLEQIFRKVETLSLDEGDFFSS
jgi:hypothetical protein